ncbi:hypothetical protein E3Q15_04344 [Wallemia mellicola]|nr:hypothetical protein E3Q15_04344 [Wallemia mellicola]
MSAIIPSLDYAEVKKADENDKNQFTDSKSDKSKKFKYTNFPFEEEFTTLRKVSESVSYYVLAVVIVELAERFSYYSSKVVAQNYIQYPLPDGSITGTPLPRDSSTPGVMGMGQQVATGLTTFSTFWSYVCLVLGA